MNTLLRTLLVAAFAILSTASNCQIAVGPKAGINFNSFRSSKEYKNHFDVVPGLNAGAYAKYILFPYLNVRAEALYAQQGANIYDYRVISELTHRKAKVKFHNFQIPVLAEFGLPSLAEDPLQPKILLGGFYSYTFYTRESYVNVAKLYGAPEVEYNGYSDVQSQFTRNQFGLIAGLAAEMKIFSKPVSIEFRYQFNLNRVNQPGSQNSYNLKPTTDKWGSELYLQTLSINIGVTLFYF